MGKRQITNLITDDKKEKKYKSLWSNDEFILTLDLYFNTRPSERDHRNKSIVELARLIHRTPDSIYYRLGNYIAIDPEAKGKGFDNKSKHIACNSFYQHPG